MTVESLMNRDATVEDLATLRRPTTTGGSKAPGGNTKTSRWRRFGSAVLGVLLFGGAAATVYGAAWFVLHDRHFQANSLLLEGGNVVTKSEIEDQFAADRGKSVLLVPLERRRRQIEMIPWVKSATLRRILPNELRVTIRERVPVAFLRRPNGLSLVDAEGVILDIPKGASYQFPVVRGLGEEEALPARRAKMQLFAALTKDLERGGLRSKDVISEVELDDPQDARVVVADPTGAVLLHLGRENFLARYLLYLGHIEEWRQKFPNLQSVDLRYDGQVVINADPQRDLNEQRGRRLE